MKKFANKTITPKIQEHVALHVQEFIKFNFEKVTHNKEELLRNNINFMLEKGLNETILNQSLIKSSYPRSSFSYKQIAVNMPDLSKKIELAAPNDKSDFRLIGELKTASSFAETSSIIQKVIMNSENPKKAITMNAILTPGNKNKDITLQLETKNKTLLPIEMDIKAGNKANNPFSGILAEMPYSNNNEPYCIMNDPISLINIQQQRITYLSTLQQNVKAQEICIFIKHLDKLPLDNIQKNMLIQEKMFKLMSENLLSQRPSFYHAYLMDKQTMVQQLFLEKLIPYIKPDIFDNLKNAKVFIAQAIKVYSITINDVTSNINKSKQVWMGTGFEDIADDIFK